MASTQEKNTAPDTQQLLDKFAHPADCLAAWLMLEGAEVFAGAKPANLLNIRNHTRACGRNLYQLWLQHGNQLLELHNLQGMILTNRGSSLLLLLYRRTAVEELLQQPAVQRMLHKAGYPAESDLQSALSLLAQRCAGSDFPHEIGIFLGYPLKDVAGFMGLCRLPFSCQGPWKIYGAAGKSLDLAALFKQCRREMAERLNRYAISCQEQQPLLAKYCCASYN